jgi:hypothetical protein
MSPSKQTVEISETNTEFLVSLHASQKERAKTIPGYRWDRERRSWVYPKTARVYDGLIAEFGDDLIGTLKITRPGKPAQIPADQATENVALKQEIAQIRKALELISGTTSQGKVSEVQAIRAALASRESELVEVRHRSEALDKQLKVQAARNTELSNQVAALEARVQAFQTESAKKSHQPSDPLTLLDKLARDAAKDATGRDKKFCVLADRLRFNESLPIELVKELGRELRGVLKSDDRNASLHDLLTEARDGGALTQRGIDLAHLIRKQRNVMAHESTDKRTHMAQVLLCFFAAALLWPEFSE